MPGRRTVQKRLRLRRCSLLRSQSDEDSLQQASKQSKHQMVSIDSFVDRTTEVSTHALETFADWPNRVGGID